MLINETFITYWSRDSKVLERGRSLADQFSSRYFSEKILAGEILGSKTSSYMVFADLTDEASPVFNCSCPSRQNPCKHSVALLWAYIFNPQGFVHEDTIYLPGNKTNSRVTNLEISEKTRKRQQHGLNVIKTLLSELMDEGLAHQKGQTLSTKRERTRTSGLYGIRKISDRLLNILGMLESLEPNYENISALLTELYFDVAEQIEYLDNLSKNPVDPTLETRLGRAWCLPELEALGLAELNTPLLQLWYEKQDEPHARRYEEHGIWCRLTDGTLMHTINYQPYAKQNDPFDSFGDVINAMPLYSYPEGDRVRWKACQVSPVRPDDYLKLVEFGMPNIESALNKAKKDRDFIHNGFECIIKDCSFAKSENALFLVDRENRALPLLFDSELQREGLEICCHAEAVLVKLTREHSEGLYAKPLCLITIEGLLRLIS